MTEKTAELPADAAVAVPAALPRSTAAKINDLLFANLSTTCDSKKLRPCESGVFAYSFTSSFTDAARPARPCI